MEKVALFVTPVDFLLGNHFKILNPTGVPLFGFGIFRSKDPGSFMHQKTCPFPFHHLPITAFCIGLPPTSAKGSTCSNQVLYFCTPGSAHKIKLFPVHDKLCSEKLFPCFAFGIIRGLARAVLCTHVEGKMEH